MYEVFDHTADLGVRVRAATLPDLYADAGRGVLAVMAGDLGQVRPDREARIRVEGDDPTWLLFDLVSEVASLLAVARFVGCDCRVAVDQRGLDAVVRGETFDPARHVLAHEIKAVTQHGLDVRRTPTGWEAEFIVDI